MAFVPIAGIIPQYDENPNWWMKFYIPNTTTPKVMATDSTGGTQLAKCELNVEGFPTTDGDTLFIPHIEDRYDLYLFPTEAEADANNTVNALRLAENILADGSGTIVIDKRAIAVVQDQLVYVYPADVINISCVIVGGKVLQESAGDYINDADARTITLVDGLSSEDKMEIWTSSIPAPQTTESIEARSFQFASTAALSNLTNVSVFTTLDGLTIGDNHGSTFAYTGLTVVGKAGTIEIGSASVYDVNGKEFKHISSKVRLETLGLAYTETATDVLSRIISLRTNGFNVDLDPRYSVTVYNSSIDNINNNRLLSIHRGHARIWPENTMLAFTSAYFGMKDNANINIEMDVQITSDGVPVVFHDDTVDSLTDGTGAVADLTLAQVKALKFDKCLGTVFEDQCRIPTLEDVVGFCSQYGIKILPEIKQYRTAADVELMYNVIAQFRMSDNTTWSSFQISDLQEMRKYDQQCGLAWGADAWNVSDLQDMRELGGKLYIFESINTFLTNPTDVPIFESYGLDTIAFTSQRQRDNFDLCRIGVRKVFCDYNM